MEQVREAGVVTERPAPGRSRRRSRLVVWLGVLPFFAYAALFLLIPTVELLVKSFQGSAGGFTVANVRALVQPQYRSAYLYSIEVSVITAVAGGLFGVFVAYSALYGRLFRWLRPVLSTFSGVAANFAGIPLAFAFIATIGPTGVVTILLKGLGLDVYKHGFTIFDTVGLSLTYLYFQLPLMILIITPSLEGLRHEWREAAANLGATPLQFWRHVGIPVLLPSLLSAMVLLFGNSFSAYATPYALSGGYINLVPIQIGAMLSGNVTVANPNFADAMALGMIVIIALAITAYALLQRRAAKWLR